MLELQNAPSVLEKNGDFFYAILVLIRNTLENTNCLAKERKEASLVAKL